MRRKNRIIEMPDIRERIKRNTNIETWIVSPDREIDIIGCDTFAD